jgi:hypothetical protein
MYCEGWQVAKAQYQVIPCHMLGYIKYIYIKKKRKTSWCLGNSEFLYMKQEYYPLEQKGW